MLMNPYLQFEGQCEAAFRFYEKLFAGKISMMLAYGDSPMAGQTAPAFHRQICHATLDLGDRRLQGADALDGQYEKPQGFWLALEIKSVEDAERLFAALAENGVVQMPFQETFWAKRFGVVVDRFGVPWMINCGEPV